MDSLWPWLTLAALGALHGLNPSTGWLLAAGWGLRSRQTAQALRALLPIALGHVAAVGVAVAVVMAGLPLDRLQLAAAAGVLFLALAVAHLWRRAPPPVRGRAGRLGLAVGAFMMGTAHGAGLMLVPALVPLCQDAGPGTGAGPLWVALAVAGVHMAAMLGSTGLVAFGICRGMLGKS